MPRVHVYPAHHKAKGQRLEHVTDGTPCWCNPRIVQVGDEDEALVIHRDVPLVAGVLPREMMEGKGDE